MKKVAVLVVFLSVFLSCKNDSNKKSGNPESISEKVEEDVIAKTFIAVLEGEFTKDDTFQLLYSETEEPFTGLELVRRKVTGKSGVQEIVFTLPKGIYPYKLRLDVGTNKEQGTIKIESLKFKYQEEEEILISGNDFLTYFTPNPWILKDKNTTKAVFNLTVKEISNGERMISYAPYFNETQKLIAALDEL